VKLEELHSKKLHLPGCSVPFQLPWHGDAFSIKEGIIQDIGLSSTPKK
jgi:hypothetical protein